ncbi:MAG TPA: glutamyl-tRNA reductase, partial [Myxococcota bacterium]|nr:glutamyl-tRNA reductase [Myxococcota bacterium]
TRSLDAARHRLRAFFSRDLVRDGGPADFALDDVTYQLYDGEAVSHLFRVAAALDSMVVGEPQILGQVKDAYRAAVDCGSCGPILGRLFQHAFATAKRVKSETEVGEKPISLARLAVDLAKQIFERFEQKRALLIGAGEMSELALATLQQHGLASIGVANRTPERAAQLAARFGATAHGIDELESLLRDADVVLTSIGGHEPILSFDLVARVLRERRHRPLFVIDIGVPRNADPAIDAIDNLYRYDLDDLASIADENAEQRRREAERATAIVVEEQQRFDGWFAALRAVPTIRHLRDRAERIRSTELCKACARLGLDDSQQAAVDALTRSIVNKILHAPVSRLKREVEREEGMAYLEVARVLFELDGEPDRE